MNVLLFLILYCIIGELTCKVIKSNLDIDIDSMSSISIVFGLIFMTLMIPYSYLRLIPKMIIAILEDSK